MCTTDLICEASIELSSLISLSFRLCHKQPTGPGPTAGLGAAIGVMVTLHLGCKLSHLVFQLIQSCGLYHNFLEVDVQTLIHP